MGWTLLLRRAAGPAGRLHRILGDAAPHAEYRIETRHSGVAAQQRFSWFRSAPDHLRTRMRSASVSPSSAQPHGKRSAKSPKLRPATFDDYEQIARLETRYGLHAVSYAEWSHLWL